MSEASEGALSVESRVNAALEEIRPYLQRDGGDVQLVGIKDNIATVKLQGACVGCPMSQMTLKNGVERFVRERVPEIESVEAERLV